MTVSVYVISAGSHFKVGVSRDPRKRLGALQTSLPIEASLIYEKEFPDRGDAIYAERACHKSLTTMGFHARGEWFIRSLDAINHAKSIISGEECASMPEFKPTLQGMIMDAISIGITYENIASITGVPKKDVLMFSNGEKHLGEEERKSLINFCMRTERVSDCLISKIINAEDGTE